MPSPGHPHARRDVLRWLTSLGVGLAVGSLAHGSLYERHTLGVTRCRLPVPGLAPALSGLRVGLLTDTHHSDFVSAGFIHRAVSLLQAERPDVIVLGGDYVTQQDLRFARPSAEALGPLTAPHGVFAVLGNHDDDVEVPRALKSQGLTVLRDERTRLLVRGEALDLIGLRYWTRSTTTLERLARGAAPSTLLLAHDPRRLDDARRVGLPAVLAGHTHGGQIVLPVIGAIAARKFPVTEGLLTTPQASLFVSRGIGTVYVPCRVNCPPEVAILTLDALPPPVGQPA